MPIFDLHPGDAPLLLSFPHAGIVLPPHLPSRLTPAALALPDTDWYVDRLYGFAAGLGITTIRPHFSRYVVDLNRDPADTPLYAGAHTSTVCPTETFAGEAIYAPDDHPDSDETSLRLLTYWKPYHNALATEVARLRARHGYAIVLDAHTIWGHLPVLFEGELPDVNLGTNGGASCAPEITAATAAALGERYPSLVVDGRFKGGYITRHYGRPGSDVHAIQIELNQRTYLADGSRTEWDGTKAELLSAALREACVALLAWTPAQRGPLGVR
jgi:N-formylglutamate amidohydrolase